LRWALSQLLIPIELEQVPVISCISAVQHLRRMRGGSQSHLLRASDGAFYVTKFQNNPQHARVLANEMLATRLGVALGLPMPPVKVIEVCDWLIMHTPDLRIQLAGKELDCQSGKQLGVFYVGGDDSGLRPITCLASYSRVFAIWLISPECWFSTNGRAMPMDGRQSSVGRDQRARSIP
jgi:hypothetical protein